MYILKCLCFVAGEFGASLVRFGESMACTTLAVTRRSEPLSFKKMLARGKNVFKRTFYWDKMLVPLSALLRASSVSTLHLLCIRETRWNQLEQRGSAMAWHSGGGVRVWRRFAAAAAAPRSGTKPISKGTSNLGAPPPENAAPTEFCVHPTEAWGGGGAGRSRARVGCVRVGTARRRGARAGRRGAFNNAVLRSGGRGRGGRTREWRSPSLEDARAAGVAPCAQQALWFVQGHDDLTHLTACDKKPFPRTDAGTEPRGRFVRAKIGSSAL